MGDRSYFIAIPARLANLDVPASHKMVAGSIFTRTYLRDKGGFIAIRARYFMEDWGLQETAITASLKWLKEQGVIETKRTRYGTLIRWVRSDVDESFGDEPNHNENEDPEKQGSRNTGLRSPENEDLRSPKNGDALVPYTGVPRLNPKSKENRPNEPSITENKSTQAGAGRAGRAGGRSVGLVSDSSEQRTVTLLNPNGYQPKSKPRAATLSKAQADLCCQFLGATGEEAKLPTLVTQEQADKPGFIESCLRMAIDAAAAGKVKGRRVAYLAGILANHWDDGRWEVQMSEADAKELVSIENDRWLLTLTAPTVYEKDRDEYVAKRTAKLDERERKVMAKYGK